MKDTRKSQCARLFQLFVNAQGREVPLPEILELKISQYGARIYSLRRMGFRIENRTAVVNGTRHSWFRLVPNSNKKESAPVRDIQPIPDSSSHPHHIDVNPTLFGNIEPHRSYLE